MVFGQTIAQELESLFGRVHHLEEAEVLSGNGARVHHGLKIDQLAPVLAAINYNQDFLSQLSSLSQGENLEQFVERSKAPRKDHQRLGQIGEPKLPHEEVVEV